MKPQTFLQKLLKLPARLTHWPGNIVLGLVGLVLIMAGAMAWSEPLPGNFRAATLARVSVTAAPSASPEAPTIAPAIVAPTPIPEEWATNREMGTGIVMGAVALVLIIVVGTLRSIRRK